MHKKLVTLIVGLISTSIFLWLTQEKSFNRHSTLVKINHILYDVNLSLFYDPKRTDNIVIVDIDDRSIQLEGHWPWTRDKIASLVQKLFDNGATVVTFDILFPEEEKNVAKILLGHIRRDPKVTNEIKNYLSNNLNRFDNNQKLATVIQHNDVVLGEFFSSALYSSNGKLGNPLLNSSINKLTILKFDKFIGNLAILTDAAKCTGFTTTTPDQDGVIRKSPLIIEYDGKIYPSLALAAVKNYLLIDKINLDLRDINAEKNFLGITLDEDIYIPTDRWGNIIINYRGSSFSFPYISATDLIKDNFNKQLLAGKIVLIGSSAVGIGDLHSTPLETIAYPGTEVHANIIASILDNKLISSPLWMVGVERILIVILGILMMLAATFLPALASIFLSLLLIAGIFILNMVLLTKANLLFPSPVILYLQVLFLTVVNSCCGYLFETRNLRKLHKIYGQYVSSDYIKNMLKTKGNHSFAGNTKSMTVLFTDVRNFTSISEKLEAKEVKQFLNTLFTPLTEIIFKHRGTIDKYVGDLIMAFWNDPIDDPEHATHCVQAALAMQTKMSQLTNMFAAQGLHDVGIRIGINTGPMHVGDMGSKYRKAYTVLGDAVNLASRLESINKLYDTKILVSEETKNACPNIVFQSIDSIYVKGKNIATKIYEPICFSGELSTELEAELNFHQQTMDYYYARDWNIARKNLEQLITMHPQRGIYKIFLERIIKFQKNPPPLNCPLEEHLTVK